MTGNGNNAPDFDPLNPTPQEAHDMLGGYLAASGSFERPAFPSVAFEHGWRMRRNDMAGVVDDDQRKNAARLRDQPTPTTEDKGREDLA
ncbi:hypothetical protein MPPM_4851 [Methylorubrum populi]|uniref:Uncharacterized protein n=1 Tax=Methylorubrum populi TaxID=223967 RepID=A0A160PK55_9HYPH|nr:hypothetical protein [Methylorubrum populi]BAU93456.1 hypothetical protein MPPM_4851 [Methylorubrum populi]